MTIYAFNMHFGGGDTLTQVMDSLVITHIMGAEFRYVADNVNTCHRTVMAIETVIFGLFKMEKPLVAAGRMRAMAGITSILLHGIIFAVLQIRVTGVCN